MKHICNHKLKYTTVKLFPYTFWAFLVLQLARTTPSSNQPNLNQTVDLNQLAPDGPLVVSAHVAPSPN
jgi:hypothetical protein